MTTSSPGEPHPTLPGYRSGESLEINPKDAHQLADYVDRFLRARGAGDDATASAAAEDVARRLAGHWGAAEG